MTAPGVYLERAKYRQRRLADAARLVPVVGALLWLLPLAWARGGPDAPNNAAVVVYIFAVWTLLIVLAAITARWAGDVDPAPPPPPGEGPPR